MTNIVKIHPEQARMILAQDVRVQKLKADLDTMVKVALAGVVQEDQIANLVVHEDGTVEYSVPEE